ncbi:hypothetical protein [uncultured Allofournierella sp.]|uniref:hypothetical protein n=1 Tax=uncultured Allofournierella sp. TaxID=1940258 RepID=UPI003752B4ED
MSYSDDYKKAMEKVSASESWKASTLQKMQQVQQSPSRRDWLQQFCFPRMAVPALCAAVLCFAMLPTLNRLSQDATLSAVPSLASSAEHNQRSVPQNAAGFRARTAELPAPNLNVQQVTAPTAFEALPPSATPGTDALSQQQLEQGLLTLEQGLKQDCQSGLLSQSYLVEDVLAFGTEYAQEELVLYAVLPCSPQDSTFWLYSIPIDS